MTKKAAETFADKIVAAGFKEQNAKGEPVSGTDFAHGWNSLDGRKRHLYLHHKNGKRVELELISNGEGSPIQRISLYDGDNEVLTTHEGVITNEKLLSDFLTHKA